MPTTTKLGHAARLALYGSSCQLTQIDAEKRRLADVEALVHFAPRHQQEALRKKIVAIRAQLTATERCNSEMTSAFKRFEHATAPTIL